MMKGRGIDEIGISIAIFHCMKGEKRKGNSQVTKGREASLNPDRIQEYDFFVTPDGSERPEANPADRREKAKKRVRNKSTAFFLSD
jgi:hypothetical protein